MDIDPAKITQAPRAETNRDAGRPRMLCLGVVVWSDDPDVEPTVLAHDSPVVVAHATALAIHEVLEDSPAYVGASEFLETHRGPRDWRTPEDVDAWLEALREATPHPAYSFHQIPVGGGNEKGDDAAASLHHAMQERERALTADAPAGPGGAQMPRPGLTR
ncbi:hypothetical protein [Microbacterium sp. SORGH_AS_0888]|uniref:hypothetical protein n=1 Tax=Microbacterium sp. SORGH_AS_0888 TaxID=3041791 RepID=UPI002785DEDC|nr:hypothetical protein [Microbacterium sp. SORGH_AS_0888]MDQ1128980.1 hypothetical protein [Microbacterium sp. SORGH_AS_0888]